jgi:hypothetical protein
MAAAGPLLQTAKMNDVDPHAWLTQTLERLALGWPISQIDAPHALEKPERLQLGAHD